MKYLAPLLVALTLAAPMATAGDSKDSLQTKVLLHHQARIRQLELRVAELERVIKLHAKAIGNVAVKAEKAGK